MLVLFGVGCASYTDHIREAQLAIVAGQPANAIVILNEQLDVDTNAELPKKLDKNRVLLLLERATLLQSLGYYELSARDMSIADQRLEWLDISESDSVNLGKYLYSDDAGGYRAPAYERLMLNTLNMVNFMAMGNMQGARVEARRFALMERFFIDDEERSVMPGLLGLGNYLSGASFEAGNDLDAATRHYARAWIYGVRPADLRARLTDLIRVTGYQGRDLAGRGDINELINVATQRGSLLPSEYRELHQVGDTIIIVQSGLVPYRRAERVPIGAAMVYASSSSHRRHHMSAEDRRSAQDLAVRGVLKWVNFPVLTDQGLPGRRTVTLKVDGKPVQFAQNVDVTSQVNDAWNQIAGSLMAAAITRMVTRAVAGEVSRAAAGAAARSQGANSGTAGALGWLAAIAIEGTLSATDTPDTRSWTTLAANIRFTRIKLDHGLHQIEVTINGKTDRKTTGIDSERLNVVNFSRLR